MGSVDVHFAKLSTHFLNFWICRPRWSGTGTVLVKTPGPVEELVLENNKLVVDGKFAFARSSTLNYSCQKATKSLLGSATSGEGMVQVLRRHRQGVDEPYCLFPSHFLGAGSVTAKPPTPLGQAGLFVVFGLADSPLFSGAWPSGEFIATPCSSWSSYRTRLRNPSRKRRSKNRTRHNTRPSSCPSRRCQTEPMMPRLQRPLRRYSPPCEWPWC